MEDKFFRSTCGKCGLFVDSTYCEEVEGKGYRCAGCDTIAPYSANTAGHGQKYYIRMSHIDGRDKAGQITLKCGIENFVRTAGFKGWLVTEYTPITPSGNEPVVKVETTVNYKPQIETRG